MTTIFKNKIEIGSCIIAHAFQCEKPLNVLFCDLNQLEDLLKIRLDLALQP